jgi:hypothetical protein
VRSSKAYIGIRLKVLKELIKELLIGKREAHDLRHKRMTGLSFLTANFSVNAFFWVYDAALFFYAFVEDSVINNEKARLLMMF